MLDMDVLSTLLTVVAIPFMFFLLGYFTYNALKLNKRKEQGATVLEAILLPVLTSVVITSWVSMALLILGVFSLFGVLVVIVIYTVPVAVKFRDRLIPRGMPKIVLEKRTLFLILLVVVVVVLFFRPYEETLGCGDGYA